MPPLDRMTVEYPDNVVDDRAQVGYSLGEQGVTFDLGGESGRQAVFSSVWSNLSMDLQLPSFAYPSFADIFGRPETSTSASSTSAIVSPTMPSKTWKRFIPPACYVLAAVLAIVAVWTRVPSIAFYIPVLVAGGIFVQREQFSKRAEELGPSLIEEAYIVHELYPGEYPAYFDEAKYELVRLGLDYLVAELPKK